MRFITYAIFISYIIFFSEASACPESPLKIDPRATISNQFDSSTGFYTYTLRLRNGSSASVGMFTFSLEVDRNIIPISAPPKWDINKHESYGVGPGRVSFVSLVEKLVPGSEEIEFKFRTKASPGKTRYYALGFTESNLVAKKQKDDSEMMPKCPGFYPSNGDSRNLMVSGVVEGGPTLKNQYSANMIMKVKKNNPPLNFNDESSIIELSPKDNGDIFVIIDSVYKTKLSTLDLESLTFGRNNAKPKIAQLTKNRELVSGWKNKPTGEMFIYLKFSIKDLGIKCDLDRSLILRGNAGERLIFGALPISPIPCTKELMP